MRYGRHVIEEVKYIRIYVLGYTMQLHDKVINRFLS